MYYWNIWNYGDFAVLTFCNHSAHWQRNVMKTFQNYHTNAWVLMRKQLSIGILMRTHACKNKNIKKNEQWYCTVWSLFTNYWLTRPNNWNRQKLRWRKHNLHKTNLPFNCLRPNIVERLKLLLRIQEVPGSNLGRDRLSWLRYIVVSFNSSKHMPG
jgi:hypothetical protein